MNDENNKYLNDKYGDMIRKFEYKGEQLPFWFECGDGWLTLIDTLCACIKNELDFAKRQLDLRREKGQEVPEEEYEVIALKVQQVKEKFGGLRFYVYGGNETTQGMIRLAESMSHKICECCGKPGKLKSEGWWRTMCDPCRIDDEKRKAEWNTAYQKAAKKLDEENNGG